MSSSFTDPSVPPTPAAIALAAAAVAWALLFPIALTRLTSAGWFGIISP